MSADGAQAHAEGEGAATGGVKRPRDGKLDDGEIHRLLVEREVSAWHAPARHAAARVARGAPASAAPDRVRRPSATDLDSADPALLHPPPAPPRPTTPHPLPPRAECAQVPRLPQRTRSGASSACGVLVNSREGVWRAADGRTGQLLSLQAVAVPARHTPRPTQLWTSARRTSRLAMSRSGRTCSRASWLRSTSRRSRRLATVTPLCATLTRARRLPRCL